MSICRLLLCRLVIFVEYAREFYASTILCPAVCYNMVVYVWLEQGGKGYQLTKQHNTASASVVSVVTGNFPSSTCTPPNPSRAAWWITGQLQTPADVFLLVLVALSSQCWQMIQTLNPSHPGLHHQVLVLPDAAASPTQWSERSRAIVVAKIHLVRENTYRVWCLQYSSTSLERHALPHCGHKHMMSQDRWSLATGSVALKYGTWLLTGLYLGSFKTGGLSRQ